MTKNRWKQCGRHANGQAFLDAKRFGCEQRFSWIFDRRQSEYRFVGTNFVGIWVINTILLLFEENHLFTNWKCSMIKICMLPPRSLLTGGRHGNCSWMLMFMVWMGTVWFDPAVFSVEFFPKWHTVYGNNSISMHSLSLSQNDFTLTVSMRCDGSLFQMTQSSD